jgi:hypothetical protein
VVVLPLLATLAGCAAPGPGPVAAAAGPGSDPAGQRPTECLVQASGHHGSFGLPSVAAAVAYETLATRVPRGEFSLRRVDAGEVMVRERAPGHETVRRVVRNEHGWITSLEESSHPACAAFGEEFALPGEPLAVPAGRSVVADVCAGGAFGHWNSPRAGAATPVLAVAAVWQRGQPEEPTVRTVGERRALVRLRAAGFRYVYDVRNRDGTWHVRSYRVGGCPSIAAEFERPGQPYRGPAFRRAGR